MHEARLMIAARTLSYRIDLILVALIMKKKNYFVRNSVALFTSYSVLMNKNLTIIFLCLLTTAATSVYTFAPCWCASSSLGNEQSSEATNLNKEANSLYDQGKYAEAEPLYRRVLAIREKALGPDHPSVATSLNNLAELLDTQGKYAEAEPLYRRSLAIREKALGPDHPDVALSLNNLAALLDTQGKYAEAEPLYCRSLAIREKALGPEHPYTITTRNNLNTLLKKKQ